MYHMKSIKNILILGASGMVGSTLIRYFSSNSNFRVYGSVRTSNLERQLKVRAPKAQIISSINVENSDDLSRLFASIKPNLVVNCVGLVKQLSYSNDPLLALPINSLLPHRLAHLCQIVGARLVHFSSDCVFSGKKGNYIESDVPDATDLYGRSKLLGEVDYPNAITLRTSLIGHELQEIRSLVSWFLAQESNVQGFTKTIFSGLPAVEMARVIQEYVLPHPDLHGVYHLSVDPISKHDLLSMVKDAYGKKIEIIPDDSLVIDRSLDSTCFREVTGFVPKPWPELVQNMHNFG